MEGGADWPSLPLQDVSTLDQDAAAQVCPPRPRPRPRLREAHLSQTSTRLQPDVRGQQRPCDAGRSVRDFGAADLDNSAA